jgi:hypothetical protein
MTDLPHRVSSAGVGRLARFISVRVRVAILVQRARNRSPPGLRHLASVQAGRDPRLHGLNKRISAKEDLPFEVPPRRRLAGARSDEVPVARNGSPSLWPNRLRIAPVSNQSGGQRRRSWLDSCSTGSLQRTQPCMRAPGFEDHVWGQLEQIGLLLAGYGPRIAEFEHQRGLADFPPSPRYHRTGCPS